MDNYSQHIFLYKIFKKSSILTVTLLVNKVTQCALYERKCLFLNKTLNTNNLRRVQQSKLRKINQLIKRTLYRHVKFALYYLTQFINKQDNHIKAVQRISRFSNYLVKKKFFLQYVKRNSQINEMKK